MVTLPTGYGSLGKQQKANETGQHNAGPFEVKQIERWEWG